MSEQENKEKTLEQLQRLLEAINELEEAFEEYFLKVEERAKELNND